MQCGITDQCWQGGSTHQGYAPLLPRRGEGPKQWVGQSRNVARRVAVKNLTCLFNKDRRWRASWAGSMRPDKGGPSSIMFAAAALLLLLRGRAMHKRRRRPGQRRSRERSRSRRRRSPRCLPTAPSLLLLRRCAAGGGQAHVDLEGVVQAPLREEGKQDSNTDNSETDIKERWPGATTRGGGQQLRPPLSPSLPAGRPNTAL